MAEAQKFFPQFGAIIKETFSLPKFYENFDQDNGVISPEHLNSLKEKIADFKQQISS
jgi:hypothetical protein